MSTRESILALFEEHKGVVFFRRGDCGEVVCFKGGCVESGQQSS